MRHFLLIVALVFVCVGAQAEPAPVQTTLGPNNILRGEFVETRHMHGFNGPLVNEGHFTVAPGFGLIWNTEKPFAVTTVITPAGLRQNVDGEQITNLDAIKMPFLLHLYQTLGGALAGDMNALDKDFVVTRSHDDKGWVIDLQSRQADAPGAMALPFNTIRIKGHRYIEAVHMQRTDGDSEDILFRDQSVSRDAPHADERKTFEASSP